MSRDVPADSKINKYETWMHMHSEPQSTIKSVIHAYSKLKDKRRNRWPWVKYAATREGQGEEKGDRSVREVERAR